MAWIVQATTGRKFTQGLTTFPKIRRALQNRVHHDFEKPQMTTG